MSRRRALILAGGGAAGNAWELGRIDGLSDARVDVIEANLVGGASAGSTVAAQSTSGTRPAAAGRGPPCPLPAHPEDCRWVSPRVGDWSKRWRASEESSPSTTPGWNVGRAAEHGLPDGTRCRRVHRGPRARLRRPSRLVDRELRRPGDRVEGAGARPSRSSPHRPRAAPPGCTAGRRRDRSDRSARAQPGRAPGCLLHRVGHDQASRCGARAGEQCLSPSQGLARPLPGQRSQSPRSATLSNSRASAS